MGIYEKKVTPNNCALAIALPLTREAFLADLRPEAPKDYAKFYRSQVWGKPSQEELWAKYRDNFVLLFEGVAREVEQLGVKVVRSLRLTDLPSLLSDRDVVSLVSHWRGAEVEASDFVNFPGFVTRLRDSSDEIVSRARQGLSRKLAAQVQQFGISFADSLPFQRELIAELNGLLESANLGERSGFEDSPTEQPHRIEHRAYINRQALDRAFEGELTTANKMEFFDGLQSVDAIGNHIPSEFDGFLDLIVCNSVLPGEALKVMKRNYLIIGNQNPAKPSYRLLVYKAIIRTLKEKPDTFVNAMTEVRQGLVNYLQNHE